MTNMADVTDSTGVTVAPHLTEATLMDGAAERASDAGTPDEGHGATTDAVEGMAGQPEAAVSHAHAHSMEAPTDAEALGELGEAGLPLSRGNPEELDAAVDPPSAPPAPPARSELVGDRELAPAAEDGAGVGASTALVETLLETAAPQRKQRRPADGQPERGELAPPGYARRTNGDHAEVDAAAIAATTPALTTAVGTPVDELDDPAWRTQWPDNEVRIVGRLLPRASDAPALDGVQRTRMELALVEQRGDAFGTMGNLALFVMPGAPGFTPIYNEIQRARKQKRRLEPIMVEIQGVLRQLPDRDMRYAQIRNTVLMGVEAHKITRVARDDQQYAYWRRRATVVECRRYEYREMPYQRVTAVVGIRQRKPHLRGLSITHVPVEFLVAREHDHEDRFQHIGQRLLIEATIEAKVQRMGDHHPALDGIEDPRRKAQLQVLRESVVVVTMGEFPDEDAERSYHRWVKAGRPRPQRAGRPARGAAPDGPGALRSDAGRDRPRGQERAPDGNAQIRQADKRYGAQGALRNGSRERRQQDVGSGSDRNKRKQ